MDFKLVSKNNLGAVTALILVIILSQSRFFNFLLDTALGRAILILFVLFISYTNKILGVVSVLFIIIMFNTSNVGYIEGFDATHTPTMNSSTMNSSTMNTPTMNNSKMNNSKMNTSTMNTSTMNNSKMNNFTKPESRENFDTPSSSNSTTSTGTPGAEGHNLNGLEDTMKKGVKSNSIPVTKSESKENFEPFSGSFNQPFSQF